MNWSYPLPWDTQGHLQLFISGLFWLAIWTAVYLASLAARACWRWLSNLTRTTPKRKDPR